MILAERAARIEAENKLIDARAVSANAQAVMSSTEAFIAHLKLEIEKLRRGFTGTVPSVRRGCWSRWNCSSKTWRQGRPRTNWRRRRRRPDTDGQIV